MKGMCKKGRPLVVMASSSTAATQTVSRGEANLLAELTNHFRLLEAVVREWVEREHVAVDPVLCLPLSFDDSQQRSSWRRRVRAGSLATIVGIGTLL